ncbi:polyprenyl synthetase family protein [Candidatus Karelsulcia muelleri]|uniref:polyprenyl synthetase family protein n=1 Tax=Candidatus Karelsulcia muelleri TaxID=336810 RepID=UPI000D7D0473|nr:polyprenyl synthetase family protein [Candidatus Karelsulcia muelleri]
MKKKFLLKKELKIFEKQFLFFLKSKILFLKKIKNYFFLKKGKYVRPLLIFLITKMLGTISKKTYKLASIIELIHTASIIHDDVIDNSSFRRGFLTINSLWNNKIAVIFGDYIFSKSLNLALNHNYNHYNNLFSNLILKMSEGELYQIDFIKNHKFYEKNYKKIIFNKTALLLSTCCEQSGKLLKKKHTLFFLKKIGILIGLSFQIKDDLLDYNNFNQHNNFNQQNLFLKLNETKITFPFIYSFNKASFKEKKWILNLSKKKQNFFFFYKKLINFILFLGGIEFSIYKMKLFTNKALIQLNNFPNNSANKSLKTLIFFFINRKF